LKGGDNNGKEEGSRQEARQEGYQEEVTWPVVIHEITTTD
jgi:hypothetical protein